MKTTLLLFFILLFAGRLLAQSPTDILTESNDNFQKEDQSEVDDEIPHELQKVMEHPININSPEIQDLVSLNLITAKQFEALLEHIRKFGKLITLQELQVIDEFDPATIRSILPYIEITGRTAADEESHSFTFRFQQQVKDYVPADFQGDPNKITLKYRGNFNGNISCALLGEKDPGEKIIFGSGKAGFDFYSFYTQVKLSGLLNKIIIGDYSVSYGQGLTAWSGSGFSSNENIIRICKSGRGLSPSTSTDENRYLRGFAIEGKWKKIIWNAWLSSHKIDGNVELDTITGEEYIRSFLTSGYHRTQSESSGYNVCRETYTGVNLKSEIKGWKIGNTATYHNYSIPIIKTEQLYNKFDFRGSTNFNFGIDYSKNIKNLLIFGEVSTCSNLSIAYINGILISAGKNLGISIVHHNYDKQFHSLKSNAFGSNTNPANENGIYFGMNLKINRAIAITAYINKDEYPYLKFRADLPTSAIVKGVLLSYTPSKKLAMSVRYRNKVRELNNASDYDGVRNMNELKIQNIRFSVSFIANDAWDYRSKLEIGLKSLNEEQTATGHLLCQDIFFHPPRKKISLNFRYAVYFSPDFDLRFYEYENDLPGAFSIPFYYGNGSKCYINFNYKIRNVTFSTKFGRTWTTYEDDLANSVSIIDDVKLQVKLNL